MFVFVCFVVMHYFVPTTNVCGPCSRWPLTLENPAAVNIEVSSASVARSAAVR